MIDEYGSVASAQTQFIEPFLMATLAEVFMKNIELKSSTVQLPHEGSASVIALTRDSFWNHSDQEL